MTTRVSARAHATATPDGPAAGKTRAAFRQANGRGHFWRAALGLTGLFWVCVLLLLLG